MLIVQRVMNNLRSNFILLFLSLPRQYCTRKRIINMNEHFGIPANNPNMPMNDPFTGFKLDNDGSFKHFPGNTVVSFLTKEEHSVWYKALLNSQEILRSSRIAQFFSIVPPQTFHITIFDLITDVGRNPQYWPAHIPVSEYYTILCNIFINFFRIHNYLTRYFLRCRNFIAL